MEISYKLAEDYAERASSGGKNYKESFDHYLQRCLNRTTDNLVSQYKIQGLDKSGFIF